MYKLYFLLFLDREKLQNTSVHFMHIKYNGIIKIACFFNLLHLLLMNVLDIKLPLIICSLFFFLNLLIFFANKHAIITCLDIN